MKFSIILILVLFFICFLLVTTNQSVLAQGPCRSDADCAANEKCEGNACVSESVSGYGLEEARAKAGLGKPELTDLVGGGIQLVLGFVGVIFLILVIYGGITWMTAGGNEERITKAKKLLMHATIGLIIVIGAYAISYFVVYQLLEAAKVE